MIQPIHPFRVKVTRFDGCGWEADVTGERLAEYLDLVLSTRLALTDGSLETDHLRSISIRCLAKPKKKK